jgi:flagellar basal-body rod modification protein FlgD
MNALANVAAGNAAGNALAAAEQVKAREEDPRDRFLKLLVTQIQNQDPLNPLQNAELTSQIAQISTVNGIERLNAAMAQMSSSLLAAQSLQASGMIGRGVLADGNTMELHEGGAIGGVLLDDAADRVIVKVYSPEGALVEVQDLGRQAPGTMTFAWDGMAEDGAQLPQGTYKFQVQAMRDDGAKVTAATLGYGRVRSVSLDGGVVLNVGGLGAIPADQVKQII